MKPDHPTLPAELSLLVDSSLITHTHLSWIPPEQLPAPHRRLLDHAHDMTSELGNFHRDTITLEILRSTQHQDTYLREVILHKASSKQAVEYGLIEILLTSFPDDLRPEILAGITPLGTLITGADLPFHSIPQGFFSIPGDSLLSHFPMSPPSNPFFGRYNHLIHNDGSCLARILEILPPIDTA